MEQKGKEKNLYWCIGAPFCFCICFPQSLEAVILLRIGRKDLLHFYEYCQAHKQMSSSSSIYVANGDYSRAGKFIFNIRGGDAASAAMISSIMKNKAIKEASKKSTKTVSVYTATGCNAIAAPYVVTINDTQIIDVSSDEDVSDE